MYERRDGKGTHDAGVGVDYSELLPSVNKQTGLFPQ